MKGKDLIEKVNEKIDSEQNFEARQILENAEREVRNCVLMLARSKRNRDRLLKMNVSEIIGRV